MKFIAILFGFLAVASAVREKSKLPEAKRAIVQKISNSCAAEHNVDPAIFPRVADGTLPRDEITNKYLYCFSIKAGIIDETGHIVINKLLSLLGDHPRAEEFKETLTKCNDVTKENPVETVVQMHDCYAKTSPILLVYT